MQFVDATQFADARRTRDGYLAGHAKVARTGIQIYAGHEVGKPTMDRVRVYRPEASVFSKDSMASFVGKPICDDHPDELVTADNWKDYAIGQIGEEVARDGEAVRISLAVMDANSIRKVEDGKRELSVGYRATLDWVSGTTPSGEAFDAIQKDIFVDHVAVVAKGRAGPDFRIGDNADGGGTTRKEWGIAPIIHDNETKETPNMADNLLTVVLGDKAVQISAGDVAALEAYKKDTAKRIEDAEKATLDAKAAADNIEATKDAELAKKDAEIADLKAKQLSDADLDKRVAERASLIDTAKRLANGVKTDGLSDAEIRKAVVTAVRGEDAIKDKSAAYIDAAFDVLVDVGPTDPLTGQKIKSADSSPFTDGVLAMAGVKIKKEAA